MKHTTMHPAIAMIELIFSIVIMGIVMMSAPMLISTAAKSTTVALQQEGIHQAVSRMNMILTYEWDQNDTNQSCIPPVLHVTSGDSDLGMVGTTARRMGVPTSSKSHTFKCLSEDFNASTTLGIEGSIKDDIDDFGDAALVLNTTGSGGKDYIEQTTIKIATTVSYVDDTADYNSKTFAYNFPKTAPSGSSNIKAMRLVLTSTSTADELEKTIILNAFSCNTGGYEYESREF